MKLPTFATTLAAPVFGIVALAATSGCTSTADSNVHKVAGGATPIFHHLDANGDGKVTYAEFDAGFADTIFSTYNLNENGVVSRKEWDAVERANQDKTQGSFNALDRNHDGKLTREELTHHGKRRDAVVRRFFNRIDANHDGVITLQEAQTFGIEHAAAEDPANHP